MQATPAMPAPPGVPTDLSGLVERLGDPALATDVVRVFLETLPERMAVLAARSRHTGDDRTRAAHSLKSASALLGLDELAAASAALEAGLREDPQARLDALADHVAALAATVEGPLRRLLPPG